MGVENIVWCDTCLADLNDEGAYLRWIYVCCSALLTSVSHITLLPQNAIDLDQKAMEVELGLATDESYGIARKIYEEGAHSKPVAEVTLSAGAPSAIPAAAKITGTTSSGTQVVGKALDAVAAGATKLSIQYQTTDKQDAYVDCQVGGLGSKGNTNGCKCVCIFVSSLVSMQGRFIISPNHLLLLYLYIQALPRAETSRLMELAGL